MYFRITNVFSKGFSYSQTALEKVFIDKSVYMYLHSICHADGPSIEVVTPNRQGVDTSQVTSYRSS